MHIVVIGAGLLGVTTAYFLNRHGIEVRVLEKESSAAEGASYGNGGYLQSSAPDPWNAPGILKVFFQAWLASITGKGDQSAFAARTLALPGLMSWGLKFLKNANQDVFLDHLIKNMHLARYTRAVIDEINDQETLAYSWHTNGGLIIFRSEESMSGYLKVTDYVAKHGAQSSALNRDELLAKEPSLSEVADELVGAVHFPNDGAGNSQEFCKQLATIADQRGCEFSFNTSVTGISTTNNGATVRTDRGEFVADGVVIAAGAYSKKLAGYVGVPLPIAPAKGYSISIPMDGWSNRPTHVIADMGVHAGVNPMGNVLRVAGTAEFTGFKRGISDSRTEYLIGLAREIFPSFAKTIDKRQIDPWGGHRPLSADGIPMIGATSAANVYVNTGHGGLGWTQAARGLPRRWRILSRVMSPRLVLKTFLSNDFSQCIKGQVLAIKCWYIPIRCP